MSVTFGGMKASERADQVKWCSHHNKNKIEGCRNDMQLHAILRLCRHNASQRGDCVRVRAIKDRKPHFALFQKWFSLCRDDSQANSH